jgi:hypothetical protein
VVRRAVGAERGVSAGARSGDQLTRCAWCRRGRGACAEFAAAGVAPEPLLPEPQRRGAAGRGRARAGADPVARNAGGAKRSHTRRRRPSDRPRRRAGCVISATGGRGGAPDAGRRAIPARRDGSRPRLAWRSNGADPSDGTHHRAIRPNVTSALRVRRGRAAPLRLRLRVSFRAASLARVDYFWRRSPHAPARRSSVCSSTAGGSTPR